MSTLYHGSFPALQNRFCELIREQRAQSPLGPLHVIVPGQLLRLHLRRALALSGTPWLNLQFQTLHEFVVQVARAPLERDKLQLLPDVAIEPLMAEAIARCGRHLSALSPAIERAGLKRALWKTIQELRQAGLSAATLSSLIKRLAKLRPHSLLPEVSLVAIEFESLLHEHQLLDRAGLLALAAPYAVLLAQPIVLYGHDALTEIERQVVDALPREQRIAAFVPYVPDTRYDWSRRLFEWYRERFDHVTRVEYSPATPPLLSCLQQRTTADTQTSLADTSVLAMSAPTRAREIEEGLRELFTAPSAEQSPRSCAILLRNDEAYLPLLQAELKSAQLTGYVHRTITLAESPLGRSLLSLLEMLDGDLRFAPLRDFLAVAPLRDSILLEGQTIKTAAAHWTHLLLLAAAPNGLENMLQQLARTKARMALEQAAQRGDVGDVDLPAAVDSTADDLCSLLKGTSALIAALHNSRRWTDICDTLRLFVETYYVADHTTVALSESLAELPLLDALKLPVQPRLLRATLQSALRRPLAREGRFQAEQPTIASLAESLGVVYDEVVIPGLVEREFPKAVNSDPLLTDEDREALNQLLHRPVLITRRQRVTLDDFLFHSTLDATLQRVVLTYPRTEADTGRERLPSSLLLSAVRRLDDAVRDYETFEHALRTRSWAMRVPFNFVSDERVPVTPLQRVMQDVRHAVRSGSHLPIVAQLRTGSALRRALTVLHSRFAQDQFAEFDGAIGAQLAGRAMPLTGEHLMRTSASQLERYAKCPFQFFAINILQLDAYETREEFELLPPMLKGLLVHRIVEQYLRKQIAERREPFTRDAVQVLTQVAARVFHEYEALLGGQSKFLWQHEQRRVVRALYKWLEFEREHEDGFLPQQFEAEFELTLAPFFVRGRIDRVDRDDNDRERITDYKTGKAIPRKALLSTDGGRQLQLAIYALSRIRNGTDLHSARLLFVTRDIVSMTSLDHDDLPGVHARLERILQTLSEQMKCGHFFPRPAESSCSQCDVREACGAGRFTTKWARESEQLLPLLSLGEESVDES